MGRLMKIEWQKYRGSHIVALLLVPIILTILISFMNGFSTTEPLQWDILMMGQNMIKIIYMPVFLASLASIAVQLENRHDMWKVLQTSGVSMKKLYAVKYLLIAGLYSLGQIAEWLVLIGLSRFKGVTQAIPWERFGLALLSQFVISLAILTLHYWLSYRFSNALVSLSISLIGSLAGLITIFISQMLMWVIPYSWYGFLMLVDSQKVNGEWVRTLRTLNPALIVVSVLCTVLFYQLGKRVKGGR